MDRRTIMNLQKRDLVATGFVAVAGVIYLLWLLDSLPTAISGVRAAGAVILALGFAASATAVVPTVDQLLHGNKVYLAVTSTLGVVALVAGVVMLVNSSDVALAVVMAAMIAMWLIATIHHSLLARTTTAVAAEHLDLGEPVKPKVTV
jgi:predicted branched-subunit amino acid permease